MIYIETGRLSLIVQRKYNTLKYWLKQTGTENCILTNIYETALRTCQERNVKTWLSEIRDILLSIGVVAVWQ